MSILWPEDTYHSADIGCLGRLGRIFHWIGTIIGALSIALTWWLLSTGGNNLCHGVAILGIIIYLIGRALRYFLAGE